jgi:hypothetical protein
VDGFDVGLQPVSQNCRYDGIEERERGSLCLKLVRRGRISWELWFETWEREPHIFRNDIGRYSIRCVIEVAHMKNIYVDENNKTGILLG